MKLLSLGMFVFAIDTLAYDELQHKHAWRFASNGRIGAKDAIQFVGADLETISLSGSAHVELADGRVSLDQLIEMAAEGEDWPLVDALGNVLGNFVITAIDERHRHFLPNGQPRQIDFGIDLLEAPDAAE
ncbi:phage tail protein [Sphingomonas pokkalii]|uniref:Oxidoreductase n=1 Tax=Sphingomonas pokkalii TaxID=2175090 RepID=A0A2U0SHZ9_9SPHN|nr:phage tail protein [Sphingomonas pokkalii]PVX30959.1 oxidoreductase [Sphingomonas pokkalii]